MPQYDEWNRVAAQPTGANGYPSAAPLDWYTSTKEQQRAAAQRTPPVNTTGNAPVWDAVTGWMDATGAQLGKEWTQMMKPPAASGRTAADRGAGAGYMTTAPTVSSSGRDVEDRGAGAGASAGSSTAPTSNAYESLYPGNTFSFDKNAKGVTTISGVGTGTGAAGPSYAERNPYQYDAAVAGLRADAAGAGRGLLFQGANGTAPTQGWTMNMPNTSGTGKGQTGGGIDATIASLERIANSGGNDTTANTLRRQAINQLDRLYATKVQEQHAGTGQYQAETQRGYETGMLGVNQQNAYTNQAQVGVQAQHVPILQAEANTRRMQVAPAAKLQMMELDALAEPNPDVRKAKNLAIEEFKRSMTGGTGALVGQGLYGSAVWNPEMQRAGLASTIQGAPVPQMALPQFQQVR